MSSLRTRINRLAEKLGSPDQPKSVYVTTHNYRHRTEHYGEWVALGVPWREEDLVDADPLDDLTPGQRALIGKDDKVVIIVLPTDGGDEPVESLGLSSLQMGSGGL